MLRWQNADSALCPVKSPMVAWWNTGSAPQYGSNAHVAHIGALSVIDSVSGVSRPSKESSLSSGRVVVLRAGRMAPVRRRSEDFALH